MSDVLPYDRMVRKRFFRIKAPLWLSHPETQLVQNQKKGQLRPRGQNMYRCPVFGAVQEHITYGIIQAHNKATFSLTSLWIKWFAETSVVCWGLGLSPQLILPFSLVFLSPPLAHRRSRTACILGVFPQCVYMYIYIAACIPQPLINTTAIPDFSRKASMWERKQHGAENNPQIGRKRCFQKKTE